ncbi:MAG: hypothetical protein SOV90_03075 [Lachnospiraceae bacterium]|nr:hypothetical protein [Lachnospiraceae bacterium]
MKFSIDSKDFKTATIKVLQLKDGILSSLQRVYIIVNAEAGKVELLATNIDEYIKVYISNCYNLESGNAVIDKTDLKLLEKLKGELTISDIDTEKLLIQTDKKKLKINNYMWTDEFLDIPELKDLQKVLVTDEAWLLETVTNLSKFTVVDDPNKLKQVFNFNIEDNQVEALDGYKIGVRYFNERVRTIDGAENLMLKNVCLSVFKKVLGFKSSAEVDFYRNKDYIKVSGSNFIYLVNAVEGTYFNIKPMLNTDYNYSVDINCKEILENVKYAEPMLKKEQRPLILHTDNGKLYTYFISSKCESLELIQSENNTMSNDFYIGINPSYLVECFTILHSIGADAANCKFTNPKAPMEIEADDYLFLVLPINITTNNEMMENINELLIAG